MKRQLEIKKGIHNKIGIIYNIEIYNLFSPLLADFNSFSFLDFFVAISEKKIPSALIKQNNIFIPGYINDVSFKDSLFLAYFGPQIKREILIDLLQQHIK